MQEWTDWHERHADKIERTDDCWLWTACTVKGYGRVRLDGETESTHRAAYIAKNGPIEGGLVVRHMCHTPNCVRPSHLKVGTHADNSMDSALDFKLTGKVNKDQVIDIRRSYKAGESLKSIAERHGIAFGTVYPIVCGKSYSHVVEEAPVSAMRVQPRMDMELFIKVKTELDKGLSQREISEKLGIAQSAVSHVQNGTRYKKLHDQFIGPTRAKIANMELDY